MRLCEKCGKNEATNVLSGVNPPGGHIIGRTWHLCATCETPFSEEVRRAMDRVSCFFKPGMSEEERSRVAKDWRDEVNRQIAEWVLGKQPNA